MSLARRSVVIMVAAEVCNFPAHSEYAVNYFPPLISKTSNNTNWMFLVPKVGDKLAYRSTETASRGGGTEVDSPNYVTSDVGDTRDRDKKRQQQQQQTTRGNPFALLLEATKIEQLESDKNPALVKR